ncbi:MAG: DUF3473 domain-containing protein [Sedimentisphaerales bacterium]
MRNATNHKILSCLTIDVEDWFHILDSPAVPKIDAWSSLESRIERNVNTLLELLDSHSVKATFFWLGWLAERHKKLVRKCMEAGHEIACHGYAHVLAYEVGPDGFREDIHRAAPGFGVTKKAPWAFNIISEAGYQYDSSVFPAAHGHGGMSDSPLGMYFIETPKGHLLEIPMSIIEIFRHRTSLFGGGYLRLANIHMIKWGIEKLRSGGQPLIIYVHPREIDPGHPRLPLSMLRQFKCYVNLKSTKPKLKWLCEHYSFCTLLEMVENYIRSFYLESKTVPVVKPGAGQPAPTPLNSAGYPVNNMSTSSFRNRLLLLEEAMAGFLNPQVFNPRSTTPNFKRKPDFMDISL